MEEGEELLQEDEEVVLGEAGEEAKMSPLIIREVQQ